MDENKLAEEKQLIDDLHFTHQARYRCEQVSLSKIDGTVTANGNQKLQYLVDFGSHKKFAKVKLEEHIYDFSPAVINKSFEMISANEKVKHNVVFSLNEVGEFDKILNKAHLEQDWIFFREGNFQNLEFVEHLKENNPEIYQELINSGNKQFSAEYDLGFEYRANLFYMMLFDNHLINEPPNKFPVKEIKFTSLLFPNVFVPLKISTDVTEEDEETISIKRQGELMGDDDFFNQVEESYKTVYQTTVEYDFSEYRIDFVINLKFDKYSRIAELGKCSIEEEVLNNVENVCNFSLKKVKT